MFYNSSPVSRIWYPQTPLSFSLLVLCLCCSGKSSCFLTPSSYKFFATEISHQGSDGRAQSARRKTRHAASSPSSSSYLSKYARPKHHHHLEAKTLSKVPLVYCTDMLNVPVTIPSVSSRHNPGCSSEQSLQRSGQSWQGWQCWHSRSPPGFVAAMSPPSLQIPSLSPDHSTCRRGHLPLVAYRPHRDSSDSFEGKAIASLHQGGGLVRIGETFPQPLFLLSCCSCPRMHTFPRVDGLNPISPLFSKHRR
ncbi:hypothetical protein QBC35DRAFT_7277 [Podospora australis]|uniref:Secreted protein n=1 Tax=Podospora australis TaxID=1536484 RepID=A0AAN7AP22_9PEZI|nr:hypothetical protein QBC35DRAFT_7277 [Podospora australis]